MKMKRKMNLKKKFMALFVGLFCIVPFVSQIFGSASFLSASATGAPSDYTNSIATQSTTVSLDHISNSIKSDSDSSYSSTSSSYSRTIYLYQTSTNGNAILNYFSAYANGDGAWTSAGITATNSAYSTTGYYNELIYNAKGVSTHWSSIYTANKGYVWSEIDLDNSLQVAAGQGYLTISSASAYFATASDVYNSNTYDDEADTVTMYLYGYSGSSTVISKSSSSTNSTSYSSTATTLSPTYSSSLDTIELVFEVILTNVSGLLGGVNYTANYMKIMNPTVTLTTTDITAPYISYGGNTSESSAISASSSSWTNTDRTISFDVSDSGSGLYKVQCSTNGGSTFSDLDGYNFVEKSATWTNSETVNYTISENGTYIFRVVDNVGNVSNTFTYTENHIDKNSPTITISNDFSGLYLGGDVSFSVSSFKTNNDDSLNIAGVNETTDTFYYTISCLNGYSNTITLDTSKSDYKISLDDIISKNGYGVYTVTFGAKDQAENQLDTENSGTITFTIICANISVPTVCNGSDNYSFTATDISSSGLSDYTFTYSASDATNSKIYSGTISSGENSFTLVNGKYTLNLKISATCGSTTYEKSFDVSVDNTKYTVTVSVSGGTALHGEYAEGTNEYSSSFTYSTFVLENDTLTISANAGYKLYKVTVGETATTTFVDENSITFDVSGDLTINIVYRQIISVAVAGSYTYNYGALDLSISLTDYLGSSLDETLQKALISDFVYSISSGETPYSVTETNFSVGEYEISCKLSDTSTYFDTYYICYSGEFFITPKSVDVTVSKSIYDYTGSVISLEYSDDDESAEFSVFFTQNGASAEFLYAGEYSVEFVDASGNFVANTGEFSGIVTILPVIANVSSTEFVYDNTDKTIVLEILGLTGTDSVSVYYSSTSLGISNATSVKLAGSYLASVCFKPNDTSYTLKYNESETISVTIEKRAITVTVSDVTKVYDGKLPNITCTISNLASGDSMPYSLDFSNLSANAGTYTVSAKIDDEYLSNYTVSYTSGTITITKRALTVSIDQGQGKVYGEADAELTFEILSGLLDGEDAGVVITRADGEDVGTYKISLSLTNSNYELAEYANVMFTISKRLAFVTLQSATKTYGENDPSFTLALSNSNILSSDYEEFCSCITRADGEDAGTYALSFDATSLTNYSIIVSSKSATLTISPKLVTIYATAGSAEYGEKIVLSWTSDTYGISSETNVLVGNLEISGTDANVYAILQGSLTSENNANYNITFVTNTFTISQKAIKVCANSVSKVYGETDVLTYVVKSSDDAVLELSLSGSLSRVAGEDVGEYQILIGTLEDENSNYQIEFYGASLTITPCNVAIVIDNKEVSYGETAELTYSVCLATTTDDWQTAEVGEKLDATLDISLERETGDDAGVYAISYSGETDLGNYVIKFVQAGTYTINKAVLLVSLSDKTVTYSGEAYKIDEICIDGVDASEITYVYKSFGEVVENAVQSGTYEVYAVFAGNKNFEAFTTETVTLIIEKKEVSITLRTLEFIYDGTTKVPEFDVNMTEEINLEIEFECGFYPTEIGEYKFTITANETNYTCNTTGVLKIVSAFSNSNGSAGVSGTSVSFSGSSIELVEVSNSSLSSLFSSSSNGLKCVSVYQFKNIEDYLTSDDVLTVSIKATTSKEAEIYLVDQIGNSVQVSYEIVDGCYVFSVSDLTCSILITVRDISATITQAVLVSVIGITTLVALAQFKRSRKNKYFKKNTKVARISNDDIEAGQNLVESSVTSSEDIAFDEFLK